MVTVITQSMIRERFMKKYFLFGLFISINLYCDYSFKDFSDYIWQKKPIPQDVYSALRSKDLTENAANLLLAYAIENLKYSESKNFIDVLLTKNINLKTLSPIKLDEGTETWLTLLAQVPDPLHYGPLIATELLKKNRNLLNQKNTDRFGNPFSTPIMQAAAHKAFDLIKLLLEYPDIDMDFTNSLGNNIFTDFVYQLQWIHKPDDQAKALAIIKLLKNKDKLQTMYSTLQKEKKYQPFYKIDSKFYELIMEELSNIEPHINLSKFYQDFIALSSAL